MRSILEDLPLARLLLLFGVLCLITSLVIGWLPGDQHQREQLSLNGGLVGPIHIDDHNTVLHTSVAADLPINSWSSVTLGLLDQDKRYLTGFGDSLWFEEGVDSEGYYWREAYSRYDAKITVPSPGEYYLQVTTEDNLSERQRAGRYLDVEADTRGMSAIPHRVGAIIAIVLLVVLLVLRHRAQLQEMISEY
ncbi:hypothetical protein [Marinobacter xestospongiae]|uniref:hypothetical protein n=1 Tax=Marinobacter xestospongiae TaxID=994319 RepID=UPI00200619AA|nr:hypothetical protein [Marinobacter xestospongiae]MCK7567963.1 hypothetical protein [Marinobacter xestospongiae]